MHLFGGLHKWRETGPGAWKQHKQCCLYPSLRKHPHFPSKLQEASAQAPPQRWPNGDLPRSDFQAEWQEALSASQRNEGRVFFRLGIERDREVQPQTRPQTRWNEPGIRKMWGEAHWACRCPASPLTSGEGTRWFPQLCAHRRLFSESIAHGRATFNRTRTCFLLLSLAPPPIAWLPWYSFLLLVTKLYLKATGSFYLGSWGLSTQRANNDPRDKDAT